MDLNPYVQGLREELTSAAQSWGPDALELAERLTAAMESAIRLSLLEALAGAAAEITSELAPGSVELRLRGRDPEFVVTVPPSGDSAPADPSSSATAGHWVPSDGDDATLTRINLRLPQDLKDRVEEAARATGLSVNAWLVRSAAAALPSSEANASTRRSPRGGARYNGWVR